MTEHWIEDSNIRTRFWTYAKKDLGLTAEETHEALKVKSIKDYEGTKEDAFSALKKFAANKGAQTAEQETQKAEQIQAAAAQRAERAQARAADEPRLQGAVSSFPSLPVWVATEFVDASGYRWKVSIAAGLQSDLRALALAQVRDGIEEFNEMAACHGWHPANGNGYRRSQPTRPAQPAAPQPQAPTSGPPEPPPPPTGAAAPPAPAGQAQVSSAAGWSMPTVPPASAGQAQSDGDSGGGGELMTEFVKIVAPKGKPVIEFWRPNRQYAEIQYHLSAESLLGMAPELTAAGWVAAHFEDVGKEYPLPLTIEWIPSPKNAKWKDITAVHLRQ